MEEKHPPPLHTNSLAQTPASFDCIEILYKKNQLSLQGKEFGLKFLDPAYPFKILGKIFTIMNPPLVIFLSFIFIIRYWMIMDTEYHFIAIITGIICCLCALWAYPNDCFKQHFAIISLGVILVIGCWYIQTHIFFIPTSLLSLTWFLCITLVVSSCHYPLKQYVYIAANISLIPVILDLINLPYSSFYLYFSTTGIIALFLLITLLILKYQKEKSYGP